ncbi:MAG: TetR family transcriptional regulator, partial [Mesorhizobium sp.]
MRYEKGRKDASRQRIMDVATERFRSDGIAASGLAGIMGEAGLTNGAFYPHFPSKAALVRESVATALEVQATQIQELLAAGGLSMAIDAYLSAEHRDNPGKGCASAALLPEIAREPADTRQVYAE